MAGDLGRDRDLVLAPGEFAYILDSTKGLVNTIVGPNKISMSNTDQPAIWDKGKRRITRLDQVDKAIQTDAIAPEGFYIVLFNPSAQGSAEHPREGSSSVSVPLDIGHRVNLPGPVHFPLWPGQFADVIKGHHLHSNQYLLAQVYNDAEATKNWGKAVVKPQILAASDGADPTTPVTLPVPAPRSFSPGQLLIIKGTDVAFFIPPTGIKVVPESEKVYVREAVTLERLEYTILLGEDGRKRYVQGPAVVFPEPTEQFVVKDNARKFRAIELNETTGLYVKVIADYEDQGHAYKTGEELFITGKEQAIYFQREEHSIIRYGDQTKHYAVAVPTGEGRYVLNRKTGVVDLRRGPTMLLCDPREEVIVRRVLSQQAAALWYPGNVKVLQINRDLEALTAPESDMPMASPGVAGAALSLMALESQQAYTMSRVGTTSRQIAGDMFKRNDKFTAPRTITLDTKYEGAVSLSVWTGYAVLIISKSGTRRVVVGPANVLLAYDETLAPMELSTGTPKTDAKLFQTVYLRVHNNKVSDRILVETRDLVKLNLTVSYRVNFTGDDREQWFGVENYVRLLCDHMRSRIRNVVKRKGIEEFYANAIDIARDTVLGPVPAVGTPRPGHTFDENGMHVYDMEILDVSIENTAVAGLLNGAQMDALKSTLMISAEERMLAQTQRSEAIKREIATTKADTTTAVTKAAQTEVSANVELALVRLQAEAAQETARLARQTAEQEALDTIQAAELARLANEVAQKVTAKRQEIELELTRLKGETEELVKRSAAVSPELALALITVSDQALVERIATSLAPLAAMNGVSAASVLGQLLAGTPMEGVMKALAARTQMPVVRAVDGLAKA